MYNVWVKLIVKGVFGVIDSELVRRARRADLAAFLASSGVPLVPDGAGRHRHGVHDSLVIKGNMYYWNSRGDMGNSLDYLTRHMGLDFKSAVGALAGFGPVAAPVAAPAALDLAATEVAGDFRRAFAYLHHTRGISYGLLRPLAAAGLLAQEAGTNNAVFFMRDENGETVGAELVGTLSCMRFKGIRAGSRRGYGFNVMMEGDSVEYVLFFESAIDLLSFVQLRTEDGGSLKDWLLVSMGGIKPCVVSVMSAAFGGVPVLCIDNGGNAPAWLGAYLGGCGIRQARPPMWNKDWNEALLERRRGG